MQSTRGSNSSRQCVWHSATPQLWTSLHKLATSDKEQVLKPLVWKALNGCLLLLECYFVHCHAKYLWHSCTFASSIIYLQVPYHDPPLNLLDWPSAQCGSTHIGEYTPTAKIMTFIDFRFDSFLQETIMKTTLRCNDIDGSLGQISRRTNDSLLYHQQRSLLICRNSTCDF